MLLHFRQVHASHCIVAESANGFEFAHFSRSHLDLQSRTSRKDQELSWFEPVTQGFLLSSNSLFSTRKPQLCSLRDKPNQTIKPFLRRKPRIWIKLKGVNSPNGENDGVLTKILEYVNANVSLALLSLDAAVIFAVVFFQAAVVAANVEGIEHLWGLAKPISADPVRLADNLNLASLLSLAWWIVAVLCKCAAKDRVSWKPQEAAFRVSQAAVLCIPFQIMLAVIFTGNHFSEINLALISASAGASLVSWRVFIAWWYK